MCYFLHAKKLFMILSSADFFSKFTFSKNSFKDTIRVSNSLDPDQARCSVGPDLATYCLQRSSSGDKRCHLKLFACELRLLLSSDNLCKQFVPRSGTTFSDLDPNCLIF